MFESLQARRCSPANGGRFAGWQEPPTERAMNRRIHASFEYRKVIGWKARNHSRRLGKIRIGKSTARSENGQRRSSSWKSLYPQSSRSSESKPPTAVWPEGEWEDGTEQNGLVVGNQ